MVSGTPSNSRRCSGPSGSPAHLADIPGRGDAHDRADSDLGAGDKAPQHGYPLRHDTNALPSGARDVGGAAGNAFKGGRIALVEVMELDLPIAKCERAPKRSDASSGAEISREVQLEVLCASTVTVLELIDDG